MPALTNFLPSKMCVAEADEALAGESAEQDSEEGGDGEGGGAGGDRQAQPGGKRKKSKSKSKNKNNLFEEEEEEDLGPGEMTDPHSALGKLDGQLASRTGCANVRRG